MSLADPRRKGYVDAAIQTQDSSPPPQLRLEPQPEASCQSDTFAPEPSMAHFSAQTIHPELDTAYTYPLALNHAFPQLGIGQSPSTSRPVFKHPPLPYSRPSEHHNHTSSKRIFSLPQTSPESSYSKSRSTHENAMRTVSLPERTRHSLSSTENNSSLDCFEASTSSISCLSVGDRSPHRRTRRAHPYPDLPQTPSPPSSPESVLIVGSDAHVPRSFLRREIRSRSSIYGDDDGGWIAWASSPPRPIPALHGPLSLPYARCPSGAEGTIIEGDDLSRMIWGLGLDDSQTYHARNHSDFTGPCKALPNKQVPPRLQNHQISDGLLHQPVGNSDTYAGWDQKERNKPANGPRHRLASQQSSGKCMDTQQGADGRNKSDHMQPEAPEYSMDDLHTFDWNGHRGLDRREILTMPAPENGHNRRESAFLNSSAPIFIPAVQHARFAYPHIFVEPRPGAWVTNSLPRMSAIEIAHQYRVEIQKKALPTPPSSLASQWTPYFSRHSSPAPPQAHQHGSFNNQQAFLEHFDSPSLPGKDFSEELRRIAYKPAGKQNFGIGLTGMTLPKGVWTPRTSPRPSISAVANTPFGPPLSTSLSALPMPAAPLDFNYRFSPSSGISPPMFTSLETGPRTSLDHEPQSIPLSRLIQRRLSSVAEEEADPIVNDAFSQHPITERHLSDLHQDYSHSDASWTALHPSVHSSAMNIYTKTLSPIFGSLPEIESEALYNEPIQSNKQGQETKPIVKLPLKPANAATKSDDPNWSKMNESHRHKDPKGRENILKEIIVDQAIPKKKGGGRKKNGRYLISGLPTNIVDDPAQ